MITKTNPIKDPGGLPWRRTLFIAFAVSLFLIPNRGFAEDAVATQIARSEGRSSHSRNPRLGDVILMPMLGTTSFTGDFDYAISNAYTLGFSVDLPISRPLSLELEGAFGENRIQNGFFEEKSFQYDVGVSLRISERFGILHPYVGIGFMSSLYDGIDVDQVTFAIQDRWVGSAKLTLGTLVRIGNKIGIGVRGALLMPMINQEISPFVAHPASLAINDTQIRLMGTLGIGL